MLGLLPPAARSGRRAPAVCRSGVLLVYLGRLGAGDRTLRARRRGAVSSTWLGADSGTAHGVNHHAARSRRFLAHGGWLDRPFHAEDPAARRRPAAPSRATAR